MISVCIVSPAWGRFPITRLVLEQRQRLCRELASRGVDAAHLIVADDANLEIAEEFGGIPVAAPNRPLGRKCNVGLHAAAAKGFDFIVWVGSDDWIHPDIFRSLPTSIAGEPVAIRSGFRLAMVDMASGQLQRLKVSGSFGAIPWILDARLFHGRPILPIPEDLPRGLDGGLIRGLRLARVGFTWEFDDPNDFRCVDFKSNHNLTPYSGLAAVAGFEEPEPAWQTLAKWFPPDLVEKARVLAGSAPPPRRGQPKEDHKVARLINPKTQERAFVSEAGAAVLRERGWIDPSAPATPKKPASRTKKS